VLHFFFCFFFFSSRRRHTRSKRDWSSDVCSSDLVLGVSLGLAAGYRGGWFDALVMRIADVQLSFPAILIALLIDGVARIALPAGAQDAIAVPVLIVAIGLSAWVQYARTVRGSTLVEKEKEYVQAARVIGRRPLAIMLVHVLPNVM